MLGSAPGLAAPDVPASVSELTDGIAQIYEAKGTVRILKKNAKDWIPASKGMILQAGDQVLTEDGSSLIIAFDSHFLNFFRVSEKTKIDIHSIEPTDIQMEYGGIFSALDGLTPGQSYQVRTPTAIAGVRGTHFLSAYDPVQARATFSVAPYDDQHQSFLELTRLNKNGEPDSVVMLPEGFEWKSQARGDETLQPVLHKMDPTESSRQSTVFRDIVATVPGFDELRESGRQMISQNQDSNALMLQPPPPQNYPLPMPEDQEVKKDSAKKQIMKGIATGLLSEAGLDGLDSMVDTSDDSD